MDKSKLMNKDVFDKIKQILELKAQISEEYDFDIFRNQKYRELIVASALRVQHPDFSLLSDKIDFITDQIKNGEIKSCKVDKLKNGLYSLNGTFEFDKQNDPVRRKNTLKYDGFAFGIFDASNESNVLGVLYIKTLEGINFINQILMKKQEDFVKKMELCEKENKQISRDSLQLGVKEILDCPSCVIVNGEGKTISLDELKSKFNFAKTQETAA